MYHTPNLPQDVDRLVKLDQSRIIVNDDLISDDLAVFFGLAVAKIVDRAWITSQLKGGLSLHYIINNWMRQSEHSSYWTQFQRIWMKFKIPFGAFPLSWWHLFCISWEKSGNETECLAYFERSLERIAVPELEDRETIYRKLTGFDESRPVIPMVDEFTDLRSFVTAALLDCPLIGCWNDGELKWFVDRQGSTSWEASFAALGLSAGDVVNPKYQSGAIAQFSFGVRPQLLSASALWRQFWTEFSPEDRTFYLVHLEQRIASLELVRISQGGELLDNSAIANVLGECRSHAPADWTPTQLRIATLGWMWQEVGTILQEWNHAELSIPLLMLYVNRRIGEYSALVNSRPVTSALPQDLVRELSRLKILVEKDYQRCIYFDGGNWERREFTLDRRDIRAALAIPAALRDFMFSRFDVRMQGDDPAAIWRSYLDELVEKGASPTDLMIALADWAANADDLPVDFAIFDAPLGEGLEAPWQMTIDQIFCYTGVKDGFDAKAAGVPLGEIGFKNAIGQRMRYNAVKKAQNYALMKLHTPQSFLLPDISVAEDAHHGGHFAAGIRHACRVPMAVRYRGSYWKGIADVRLNRVDYGDERRFREHELVIASRYGKWAEEIVSHTYSKNLLFDKKYGVNLDDGRDVASRLGR